MAEIKRNLLSLIGMTGCGKTSVGRIIAEKSGAVFIDVDDEIVRRYGEIRTIFDEGGEGKFREVEYEVLAELTKKTPEKLTILSCGGGLPTFEKSRLLLKENTTVVWLRRSAGSVLKNERILARPPINGDKANYKRILGQRYPIYRKTADYSFYNGSPTQTAVRIIKKLINEKSKKGLQRDENKKSN